jgi:hypothetical protein
MRVRLLTRLCVVPLLAVAACSGQGPVSPSVSGGQPVLTAPVSTERTPVRMSGELIGDTYMGPLGSCPASTRATISNVTGNVTHLGLSTVKSQHCYVAYNPDGSLRFVGTAVVTAANRDEMRLTYSGNMLGLSGTPAPGAVLTGSGAVVVTGGTGRFADASGDGELRVEVTFSGLTSASPIRLSLSATIVY